MFWNKLQPLPSIRTLTFPEEEHYGIFFPSHSTNFFFWVPSPFQGTVLIQALKIQLFEQMRQNSPLSWICIHYHWCLYWYSVVSERSSPLLPNSHPTILSQKRWEIRVVILIISGTEGNSEVLRFINSPLKLQRAGKGRQGEELRCATSASFLFSVSSLHVCMQVFMLWFRYSCYQVLLWWLIYRWGDGS